MAEGATMPRGDERRKMRLFYELYVETVPRPGTRASASDFACWALSVIVNGILGNFAYAVAKGAIERVRQGPTRIVPAAYYEAIRRREHPGTTGRPRPTKHFEQQVQALPKRGIPEHFAAKSTVAWVDALPSRLFDSPAERDVLKQEVICVVFEELAHREQDKKRKKPKRRPRKPQRGRRRG